MPLITVGIPAYKTNHLSQAIASVLGQTLDDYELLISDDSPDDSVKAVVQQFRDPRIRLIEGPRRGLVPNSVHLWDHARADLLKFVYDDDFLLPFALQALSEPLKADPSLVYAFCRRHIVDATGRVVSSPDGFKGDKAIRFEPPAPSDWMVQNMRNPIGEPTNLLIRRSAFPDSSCLSAYCAVPVRHMIDVAFFLNAAARGPCLGLPQFHAAFRRHQAQVTSRQDAPGFAMGFVEWELFIRGAVSVGLASPHTVGEGLARLDYAYGLYEQSFPELGEFRTALPELRQMLLAGERAVLTDAFLGMWRCADDLIRERLREPAA